MTQEQKQLLLRDLCARLPFMPKIKIIYQQQGIRGTDEGRVSCDFIEKIVNDLRNGVIIDMQIYLRPMSSMTEEEVKEFYDVECIDAKVGYIKPTWNWHFTIKGIDWLNSHHFDYRGLFEKGLAIEVNENNNPYKD